MNCEQYNLNFFSCNDLICTAYSPKRACEQTQNSLSNQRDSHFTDANYSQFFQAKNRCGEQVLFVKFWKNFVRQNFFVAERRMKIARRFNGGKANQKMRVPTGRKKIFSIFAPDFLPPCGAWKFLRFNPAIKTAGYFQIVPFGTKFPLDRKICSAQFPSAVGVTYL
jgi:hypothetical protein